MLRSSFTSLSAKKWLQAPMLQCWCNSSVRSKKKSCFFCFGRATANIAEADHWARKMRSSLLQYKMRIARWWRQSLTSYWEWSGAPGPLKQLRVYSYSNWVISKTMTIFQYRKLNLWWPYVGGHPVLLRRSSTRRQPQIFNQAFALPSNCSSFLLSDSLVHSSFSWLVQNLNKNH